MYWTHDLSPFLLDVDSPIGPLQVPFYWASYIFSYFLILFLTQRKQSPEAIKFLQVAFPSGWLGMLLGGRLFYVLFYYPTFFIKNPDEIFKIWNGGMSFHGGIMGGALGLFLCSSLHKLPKKTFISLMERICLFLPIALFLGRIGNFLNGELIGRPTELPWGVVFPDQDLLPRHPSQLYQSFLEGPILFLCLYIAQLRTRPTGQICLYFVGIYSGVRFISEFFREPDPQLGFYWSLLTQGQLISLVLLILCAVFGTSRRRGRVKEAAFNSECRNSIDTPAS